jgi:polyphosphate glucokinase
MNILAIDIGGTHIKILLTGEQNKRSFDSGKRMTPSMMIEQIRAQQGDWKWDAASIGIPAPVAGNRPLKDPVHLAPGWVDFDYEAALGCPIRIVNDAAMQALGSYDGGKMLFLGLGTGLGSAMVIDQILIPLELGHLPYNGKQTIENRVGEAYLKEKGEKKWKKYVLEVIEIFRSTLLPDYIVLGGGNTKRIDELPPGVRRGANHNAFLGGFRLWDKNARLPLSADD